MTTALQHLGDLVGRSATPRSVSWTADQSSLYALAVGAGADDLAYTSDGIEGTAQRALPTMAGVIGADLAVLDDAELDWTRLVHASQELALARPVPASGDGVVSSTVTEVWDKRRAAVIVVASDLTDDDGRPLATSRATLLVDGAGGWGGERGPSAPRQRPVGPPDRTLSTTTRPDQALLYRLTGDHNPLHHDPAFAARAGFDRPILHGMCTYGIVARLLVRDLLEDDPDVVAGISARFAAPVVPGDALQVEAWSTDDGLDFRAHRGDGTVVLSHGRLDVR